MLHLRQDNFIAAALSYGMAEHDMQSDPKSAGLKNWLDNLQQESWQLELLISGFTLFLLIGGWEPVKDLEYDLTIFRGTTETASTLNMLYYVMRTAYLSLLACLLIHVVLRGVWIAAIGLRSVSGEIDYDQLHYQPRYVDRLRRRLGSFDDYIERMERNCSVVFSLAFLIFFCFLSLATWSLMAIFIQYIYLWLGGWTWQGQGVLGGAGSVSIVVFIMGLIYLFDFVTLGLLKKSKWLGRPYYYLYIVMGWVTLARFYRPLYYNLIDNRFGRKLAIALPIVIFGILIVVSIHQVNYAYFPAMVGNGQVWLDSDNYDDEDPNLYNQVWRMSLASRYPVNNYVRAFIPYRPVKDDPIIKKINPDLKVSQYVGTKLNGAFSVGKRVNQDADYPQMLKTLSQLYQFYINDSLQVDLRPHFHYHTNRGQPGLEYMIPTHDLPPGQHQLLVRSRFITEDSLRWSNGRTIYFYK